jgi:hypothetical protein
MEKFLWIFSQELNSRSSPEDIYNEHASLHVIFLLSLHILSSSCLSNF